MPVCTTGAAALFAVPGVAVAGAVLLEAVGRSVDSAADGGGAGLPDDDFVYVVHGM